MRYLLTVSIFMAVFAQMLQGQNIATVDNDITRSEEMIPERVMLIEKDQWLQTLNPSSIGIITIPDMGTASFGSNYLGGDYHRSQQSGSIFNIGFNSFYFKSLKKINLWGDFSFSQERLKSLNWSDDINPYNGSPYLVGSSLKGDYSRQSFNFKVKASSLKLFDCLWAGIGFDYDVTDFSRLQDPRSRVPSMDLSIRPGVIFQLNENNHIGLTGIYRYRKEKFTGYVSKAQDSNEYKLYQQEGCGLYETIVSTSFNRRIMGNFYGGELEYSFKSKDYGFITSASVIVRDDIIEDKNRALPGDYSNLVASYQAKLSVDGEALYNTFSISASFMNGSANKIFQQIITEKDPSTGVVTSHYETLFTAETFRNNTILTDFVWKSFHTKSDNYDYCFGFNASFASFSQKYVYYNPNSIIAVSCLNFNALFGAKLCSLGKLSININGAVGYLYPTASSATISSELDKNEIVDNVIMPDIEILNQNAIHYSIDINLNFLLSKQLKIKGFVAPYIEHYITRSNGHRLLAGLSLGVLL